MTLIVIKPAYLQGSIKKDKNDYNKNGLFIEKKMIMIRWQLRIILTKITLWIKY